MLYTLVIQFNVKKEKERREKRKKIEKNNCFDFLYFDIKLYNTKRSRGRLLSIQYLVYPPLAFITAASLSGMEAKSCLQYSGEVAFHSSSTTFHSWDLGISP